MPKTTLNLRIDSALKKQTEKVVSELGISMSSAIVLYFKAIVRENGIPFDMKIKGAELVKTNGKKKPQRIEEGTEDDFGLFSGTSIKSAIDKL